MPLYLLRKFGLVSSRLLAFFLALVLLFINLRNWTIYNTGRDKEAHAYARSQVMPQLFSTINNNQLGSCSQFKNQSASKYRWKDLVTIKIFNYHHAYLMGDNFLIRSYSHMSCKIIQVIITLSNKFVSGLTSWVESFVVSTVNILSWNCRRLGLKSLKREIRLLLSKNQCDVC